MTENITTLIKFKPANKMEMPPGIHSFYDLSRYIAPIILTQSAQSIEVKDVLLFGSTLSKKEPADIDMLVFYGNYGSRLEEFHDKNPYAKYEETAEADQPAGRGNLRYRSSVLLGDLGSPLFYGGDLYYLENNRAYLTMVMNEALKRNKYPIDLAVQPVQERGLGLLDRFSISVFGDQVRNPIREMHETFKAALQMEGKEDDYEKIKSLIGTCHNIEDEVKAVHNKYSVLSQVVKLLGNYCPPIESPDEVLDLHVMPVQLLSPEEEYRSARQRSAENCRDPTFWHTVLSTGRLYDITKKDFDIKIEEKYPGCLSLFPSREKP